MYYLAIHSSYLLSRRDKTSMITEVIFSFICHVNGARLMTFQFRIICFEDEKMLISLGAYGMTALFLLMFIPSQNFTCPKAHNETR